MSIKKQFLKSKPICKVTFKVSASEANGAEKIQILGNFNDWSKDAKSMKKLKSGGFTQTIELASGVDYQSRYFINDSIWANESDADFTVSNIYNDINDVISTIQ